MANPKIPNALFHTQSNETNKQLFDVRNYEKLKYYLSKNTEIIRLIFNAEKNPAFTLWYQNNPEHASIIDNFKIFLEKQVKMTIQ